MSLKSAIFEMKEALMDKQAGQVEEDNIHNLELKNNLRPGTLVFYFNQLMMQINNHEQKNSSHHGSKKVNRKWTKSEMEFMIQYIKERQEEGAINITDILKEIASLLNRGYQSVNYKYYNMIKANPKKDSVKPPVYHFKTIAEDQVPVISTEKLYDSEPTPAEVISRASDNEDLLDILSGLITNVQQLSGIHLNELFKSLYQLTNLALQNQDAIQQLEAMKQEIHHEKDELREKLKKKEQQLSIEKKRNDELQSEVSKLAKEIMTFNQLGDAAKIQNLKSYNQRLNYIIDGFGLVLKIAK